jgi:hypothetical protein
MAQQDDLTPEQLEAEFERLRLEKERLEQERQLFEFEKKLHEEKLKLEEEMKKFEEEKRLFEKERQSLTNLSPTNNPPQTPLDSRVQQTNATISTPPSNQTQKNVENKLNKEQEEKQKLQVTD